MAKKTVDYPNLVGTNLSKLDYDELMKLVKEKKWSMSQVVRELVRAQLKANDPNYNRSSLNLGG